MADMNKRILLHSTLQLNLSADAPILFVICMQNFINKKSEISYGSGGEGGGAGEGNR